jgi:hypothetical protein
MKKILVVFLAAMMAVSCFKDGPTNSHQYNLFATFEYVNDYEISEQFGKDSLYVDEVNGLGMLWNDMAFMQKLSDALFHNPTASSIIDTNIIRQKCAYVKGIRPFPLAQMADLR